MVTNPFGGAFVPGDQTQQPYAVLLTSGTKTAGIVANERQTYATPWVGLRCRAAMPSPTLTSP